MSNPAEHASTTQRYTCHCCHKRASICWSDKRLTFICDNCKKTFDAAVIARRNDMTLEQLTLC